VPNPATELFEVCTDGVSSAFEPELILPTQLAWAKNVNIRGGKPSTRRPIVQRLELPPGLVQGADFFSVQGGMLIASIAGHLYRIWIGERVFSCDEIPLAFENSPVQPEVWMEETVGSFLVQDGQSRAIIYDGADARRSDPLKDEVPIGRQMAYGNGRLWVAKNGNELVAGDICQKAFQSELKFTEIKFLVGGGSFYFPRKMQGLAFLPTVGNTGTGGLIVFGRDNAETIRADITSRDLWSQIPGFNSTTLRTTGAAGHRGIVEVNQDLYWRDGDGGIRSLSSAVSDQAGAGSAPISREVRRLTDTESSRHLAFCSGVVADNRLLMTASPFLNCRGGVSFRDIISLDLAMLASMRGKAPPAYDGEWDGLDAALLVAGTFNGRKRAFAISTDTDGKNRLWEFMARGTDDVSTVAGQAVRTPIQAVVEYSRRNFGSPGQRKRLTGCEVFLSGIEGDVALDIFWRCDNHDRWNKWDEVKAGAQMSDPSTTAPHRWKNLKAQHRPGVRTFTIPDEGIDENDRARCVGFEFQFRLVWTGRVKIHRVVVVAQPIPEPAYADRDDTEAAPIEYDVSGNDIHYEIPTG